MDFTVLTDHRVKSKEGEKRNKYLDRVRELKNMKVTVIQIVVGALGMITKRLIKGLEDLKMRGW